MIKPINIEIKNIPHKDQRYPTCGDWQFNENGDLLIIVSDMGDWKYNFLVALHELVEVMLCKDRGISQETVDNFDIDFESKRKEGNVDEPGNDPQAPYFKEHLFATIVEKMMANELNVDWKTYDETVNNL